jgi:hypothetical protein
MSKNLTEALLVMIIAMPAGIIDTTDIENDIQCIKDLLRSSIRKWRQQVSAMQDTIKISGGVNSLTY